MCSTSRVEAWAFEKGNNGPTFSQDLFFLVFIPLYA